MTQDIVERLRGAVTVRKDWDGLDSLLAEAAAEIERLRPRPVEREGWQPIETAPVTEPMKRVRVLTWSKMTGVCVGDLHRWEGEPPTVNLPSVHGDAVAAGWATHWRPMIAEPESPALKHEAQPR
jgi:hypothetical protein